MVAVPRLRRLDLAIAAVLAAWAVAEALLLTSSAPVVVRVAFGLAATLPLAARSVAPVEVAAIAVAAFLVDTAAVILPVEAVTPLPGVPVALASLVALAEPRRLALLAGVMAVPGIPAATAMAARDAPITMGDVASLAIVSLAAVVAGWRIRVRRETTQRDEALARAAHAAREVGLQERLVAERLRLASELRAVVAGALDDLADRLAEVPREPAQLMRSAEEVGAVASGTVVDMQRLLRVLRDGAEGDDALAPVTIDAAAAAARARGWVVEVSNAVDPAGATQGAAVALARVVEELLDGTPDPGNAAVRIAVRSRGGDVRARIAGAAPPPRALADAGARARMTERVGLHGGRLRLPRASRRARGWTVRASVPVAARSAPSRRLALEGAVLGAVGVAVIADALAAEHAAAVAGFAAAFVATPILLRRRWPLFAVAVLAGGQVLGVVAGVLPDRPYETVPIAVIGAASVAAAATSPWRAVVGGVALVAVAVAVTAATLGAPTPVTDLPIVAFLVAMAWLFGWRTRAFDGVVRQVRRQEVQAALAHGARVRAVLDDERRAVARDLHDVVAHGISLIAVLAGAARATASRDPVAARGHLAGAAEAVRGTRAELLRLMAMLGGGGEASMPVPPADVGPLLRQAAESGQRVDITGALPPDLPAATQSSVYRIVQESLTNARKHAPGERVNVHLGAEDGAIVLTITNDLPADPSIHLGSGQGIAGMRERVRLLDGHLAAGPDAAGRFLVRAALPIRGAAHSGTAPNGVVHAPELSTTQRSGTPSVEA